MRLCSAKTILECNEIMENLQYAVFDGGFPLQWPIGCFEPDLVVPMILCIYDFEYKSSCDGPCGYVA